MNKKRQLEIILGLLSDKGFSVKQIMEGFDSPIKKRTLQWRLKVLKDNNLFAVSGTARATRYFSKENEPQNEQEGLIPMSSGGKEILTLVSRPESQRIPAGYNREFLKNYRPNKNS